MKVKCAWLYHNIMDLYGDRGNILSLQKRARDHGIEFELETIDIGRQIDLSDFDLIFLGGGADLEQQAIMPDLLSRRENLAKAIKEHSFVLLICGGYQFFGQYYEDVKGNRDEGLGFFDYYTTPSKEKKRCIGNVIIEADLDGEKMILIGFENHGGQTHNVKKPLGKVLHGFGNSFEAGYEGYYDGQVLGTYLHGPLLPKNSRLTDFILVKALQKRHPDFRLSDLKEIPVPFEKEARAALLQRYDLNVDLA